MAKPFSPDLLITYAALRAYVETLRPIAELLSGGTLQGLSDSLTFCPRFVWGKDRQHITLCSDGIIIYKKEKLASAATIDFVFYKYMIKNLLISFVFHILWLIVIFPHYL